MLHLPLLFVSIVVNITKIFGQSVHLLRGLERFLLEFLIVVRPNEVHQQPSNSSLVSSSIVRISLFLLLAEATVRDLIVTVFP